MIQSWASRLHEIIIAEGVLQDKYPDLELHLAKPVDDQNAWYRVSAVLPQKALKVWWHFRSPISTSRVVEIFSGFDAYALPIEPYSIGVPDTDVYSRTWKFYNGELSKDTPSVAHIAY